jgi:hypothetical protein
MMRQGYAAIRADESQFHFGDVNSRADITDLRIGGNGLVAAAPGLAVITTGTPTGPVSLRLELHDDPPIVQFEAWDEIVEVSMRSITGATGVIELFHDWRQDLPLTIAPPQSWLRLRVHARDRDHANDPSRVPKYPIDSYLIQVWRAAGDAPDTLHKTTDQLGQALRANAHNR